jgi:hypothetical protein
MIEHAVVIAGGGPTGLMRPTPSSSPEESVQALGMSTAGQVEDRQSCLSGVKLGVRGQAGLPVLHFELFRCRTSPRRSPATFLICRRFILYGYRR